MFSVFHEPWWLEAVSLNGWREARVEENGQPVARLPYVDRSRYGLTLLMAPPFTNRLGPLVIPGDGGNEARLRRFDHLVGELIDQLPRADMVRQSLHPDTLSWLPFYRRGFRVEPQVSYVIDQLDDLDAVYRGIAGRTRRVIRKAEQQVEVQRDDTAERLVGDGRGDLRPAGPRAALPAGRAAPRGGRRGATRPGHRAHRGRPRTAGCTPRCSASGTIGGPGTWAAAGTRSCAPAGPAAC